MGFDALYCLSYIAICNLVVAEDRYGTWLLQAYNLLMKATFVCRRARSLNELKENQGKVEVSTLQ